MEELEVSIGICAFNEAQNMENLLNFLRKEIGSKDEILIVVSGSTDGTDDIVRKMSVRDDRIRLIIEEERFGKSQALSKILKEAKKDLILYLSADAYPVKGSIRKLVHAMKRDNLGLACAYPFPLNEDKGLVNKMGILLWSLHGEIMKELSFRDELKHASDMFCVRKGIVNNIPLNVINDDGYLAMMFKRKGLKVKLIEDAKVKIWSPDRICEFLSQRRRILYGHMINKRILKESPNYMGYLLLSKSKLALKVLIKTLTKKPYLLSALILFLVEIISYLMGILDLMTEKDHKKWSIAYSTKRAYRS